MKNNECAYFQYLDFIHWPCRRACKYCSYCYTYIKNKNKYHLCQLRCKHFKYNP